MIFSELEIEKFFETRLSKNVRIYPRSETMVLFRFIEDKFSIEFAGRTSMIQKYTKNLFRVLIERNPFSEESYSSSEDLSQELEKKVNKFIKVKYYFQYGSCHIGFTFQKPGYKWISYFLNVSIHFLEEKNKYLNKEKIMESIDIFVKETKMKYWSHL